MKNNLIGGLIGALALTTIGSGWASPAAAKNVGYYELCSGQGVASQVTPIVNAGETPVQLFNLTAADLAGVDVAFVTNCSNGAIAFGEWAPNLPAITAAVNAGLVLVFHDRHVTTAAANIPGAGGIAFTRFGGASNVIDVVNNSTLVTNGLGGIIGNSTLVDRI